MEVKEIFRKENLLINVDAADKESLIRKMAETAAENSDIRDVRMTADDLYAAVIQREEQFSTAIGEGLLFPHARFEELHHRSVIVIATLKSPFECETPDRIPIRIACMVLIPEDQPMQGLKFIASFARKLKSCAEGAELASASSPEEALLILNKMELTLTDSLTAADVMAPFRFNVTPEMSLKTAVRMMVRFGIESVPVMDGRKLIGELSSCDLFRMGIPSGIDGSAGTDPLEKYFAMEAELHVADVMNPDIALFQKETSLSNVVCELSTKESGQVYITDKHQELRGIIDRTILLERIHNL